MGLSATIAESLEFLVPGLDHGAMRLLLVQAPFRDTFGYSMPPPGLLRLGGELRRLNYNVELEDLAFRLGSGQLANGDLMCESAARWLQKRGEFDVIGFSVMGATLPAALEIARRLRELSPSTKLLLGGPGMTGADVLVLERFPFIDAVVRGEAERSLPPLLDRFALGESPEGLAGITWRDVNGLVHIEAQQSNIQDLGELAPYAWELLEPLTAYKAITGEREGLTPLDSGRGCAFDCSFCTIGRYWQRSSRPLPAARLVEEIHALDFLPGAQNAYLCHDIFGADRKAAVEFCEGLIERGVRPWECRARVDHLDRELLRLMGRSGCYRVLLGIESGSQEVRALANKGQFAELDVEQVIANCAAAGIRPILSLILGLPGEGEAQLEESLELLSRASLITDAVISLHLPNPQIGCDLHRTHGDGARPVAGIAPDMAFGSGETKPELALIEAHPDLFSSWSLLPGEIEPLQRLACIATTLPQVLMAYPRTWVLLKGQRAMNNGQLFWAWRASGVSFEQFARRSEAPLVQDALRWEQTVAEQNGPLDRQLEPQLEASEVQGWIQSRARVVRLQHDVVEIQRELVRAPLASDPLLASTWQRDTWIAVSPTQAGVASDRVSPQIGQLLQLLEEPQKIDHLEARWPNIREALQTLGRVGLITSHPELPTLDTPP